MNGDLPQTPTTDAFDHLDHTETVERSWPRDVRERAAWMPADEKMPFAKYHDHPALPYYREFRQATWSAKRRAAAAGEDTDTALAAVEADHRTTSDPRRSWSDPSNWRDFETADEWVRMDPPADDDAALVGRAFIMQRDGDPYRQSGEADPYLFADGDNVRDPDTGDVIPEFVAAIEVLTGGEPTFMEVSMSGGGEHGLVEGKLPDGTRTKYIQLRDEPVFGHDEPPMLELYEGPKVAVLTGKRVAGTPEDIAPADPDGLTQLLDVGTDAHPNVLAAAAERAGSSTEGAESTAKTGIPSSAEASATLPDEAPENLPRCYKRALRARYGDPEAVAGVRLNNHGVNLMAANLGIHAGYSVEECVEHFATFLPDGKASAFNRQITRKSLAGTKTKAENDDLAPPTTSTLQEVGLFDADERCAPTCPIHGTDRGTNGSGEQWLGDPEHIIVSNAPVELARRNAWDWQHADQGGKSETSTALSIDDARERTTDAIAAAYRNSDRVIIDALPTTGKSYGSKLATVWTGEQNSYLTGRGHEEQYERAKQRCERMGLSYIVLPSVYRDCPCFNGDHGDEVKEDVRGAYANAATAKEIHVEGEDYLGYKLPCQHEDEHCPWSQWWSGVDLEEYDVVIGYYTHAFIPSVTQQRTVVFDEFVGDAFVTTLGGGSDDDETSGQLPSAVTHFLSHTPALQDLGLETYSDVMAARHDDEVRADALGWLDMSEQPLRDPGLAFARGGHALAPLATLVLLASAKNDLGNGWERTTFTSESAGDGIGIHDGKSGTVRLLTPPDIPPSSGLVCLDGTPTQELWELATGQRLNHRQVLTDDERIEYLCETLGHRYVLMSEHVKPYSSGEYVNVREDAAILDYIQDQEGEKPALITPRNALNAYDRSDEIDIKCEPLAEGWTPTGDSCVSATKYYGNLIGSNDLKFTRSLAVIGSPSFGDGFVEKWGAFAGEGIERSGKGVDLEYSGIGQAIHEHMSRHQVMQAAMRAGRDGRGATVYIGTCMVPDLLEEAKAAEGRVIKTRRKGERDVLRVLRDRVANGDGEWSTKEIADHPEVSIEADQVRIHLNALHDRGYLDREMRGRDGGGCGYAWSDAGLHRVNDHGEIELEPVVATPSGVGEETPAPGAEQPSLEEVLSGEAIDGVHRRGVYTFGSIYSPPSPGGAANEVSTTTDSAVNGGDPGATHGI